MTDKIKQWVKDLPIDFKAKTLEIGSRYINGSVKEYFNKYTGIDMMEGKNVDKVMRGNELTKHFKQVFQNVLYLETMEHDDRFWETLQNIKEVTKPKGHLILTVPGINFHHHDYPSDYFRFTKEGVESLINYINFDIIQIEEHENHCKEKHVFCLAKKN